MKDWEEWEKIDLKLIRSAPDQKRSRGNSGTKTKRKYKDLICAFDIETTAIPERDSAVMYIWQFQIEDHTYIGRTWDDYLSFLKRIASCLKENEYIVIFDHNLSYEFQFLAGIYDFQPEEVFALEPRRILKCDMLKHFEYRCSYLHSNMSLDMYLSKMGVESKKVHGFDYSIQRWPWTELTDDEMHYCINDVKGLVQAVKIEMHHDGDNLYTFPLTSTGYVRRDAKRAMHMVSPSYIKGLVPDYDLYCLLREAFRGGNTHANRYYAGHILTDVKSADRSSSYPDVQCNDVFPVSKFFKVENPTIERVEELIKNGKAVLFRVVLEDVKTYPTTFCPYISVDHCNDSYILSVDNGRVLSAAKVITAITDIDWKIIKTEYSFEKVSVDECWYARYGKLPQVLIDTTISYYKKKTELKNVPGREIEYMKAKAKLNSIYGMMAQDPIKQSVIFQNGKYHYDNKSHEELLEQSNRKAFLSYAWGVWVTAWARYRLEEGIQMAGDGFVYCDTDSVKYLGDIDWSKYNKRRMDASRKSGAAAVDPTGEAHYMGVYEQEESYAQFVTLGAKKYAYTYPGSSDCYVTVAGVNKKKGAEELTRRGGLRAFVPGFVFYDGGGTELIYNDGADFPYIVDKDHTVEVTRNVLIRESTYALGLTTEYADLINIQFDKDGYLMEYENTLDWNPVNDDDLPF